MDRLNEVKDSQILNSRRTESGVGGVEVICLTHDLLSHSGPRSAYRESKIGEKAEMRLLEELPNG